MSVWTHYIPRRAVAALTRLPGSGCWLSGGSSTDLWLACTGMATAPQIVATRWTGTAWTEYGENPGNNRGASGLYAVGSEAWVWEQFGNQYPRVAKAAAGTWWFELTSPFPSNRFNGMYGLSHTNIWVIEPDPFGGVTRFYGWNGPGLTDVWNEWTITGTGVPNGAPSPGAMWDDHTAYLPWAGPGGGGGGDTCYIIKLNVSALTYSLDYSRPDSPIGLEVFTCLSSTDALGADAFIHSGETHQRLMHRTSTGWAVDPITPPLVVTQRRYNGAHGVGPSDAWIVGEDDFTDGIVGPTYRGFVLQWNGTTWVERLPLTWGTAYPWDQWAVEAVREFAANDVWIAGRGRTLPVTGPWYVWVAHWDGSAWSDVFIPAFTV